MNGEDRRDEIIKILQTCDSPISGSMLAERFGVSRQVIVQDMAVLRASNYDFISTNKGYITNQKSKKQKSVRIFTVNHRDDQISDELNTIVDAGGKVVDVRVNHGIYGVIKANLTISSRKDVNDFVNKVSTNQICPLNHLTNGIHSHTVEADSDDILNFIETELKNKGFIS